MSFIQHNIRVFQTHNQLAVKRRSECRLKNPESSIDTRAWAYYRECRRQFILELVGSDVPKCTGLGTMLPIIDIIMLLLKESNERLAALERQMKEAAANTGKSELDELRRLLIIAFQLLDDTYRIIGDEDYGVDIDNCQAEIAALEKQLTDDDIKAKEEIVLLKRYCAALSKMKEENDMLRERADDSIDLDDGDEMEQVENRLIEMGDLPDRVRDLVEKSKRIKEVEKLQNEILKLKSLLCGCECENRNLRIKIERLEAEIEQLKCKAQNMDNLKNEIYHLRDRLGDMIRLQRDYQDLKDRTKDYDDIKTDLCKCRAKVKEYEKMEEEVKIMRLKLAECDALQKERQMLMAKIEDCECCMSLQDTDLQKLDCHIECLSDEVAQKEKEIKGLQCHVECLTKQLNSHSKEKQDVACMRSQSNLKSRKVACMEDDIDEVKTDIVCSICALKCNDDEQKKELKNLRSEVCYLRCENNKLQQRIKELQKAGGVSAEYYLKIIGQTKCALRVVIEKLRALEGNAESAPPCVRIGALMERITDLEARLENAGLSLGTPLPESCCIHCSES